MSGRTEANPGGSEGAWWPIPALILIVDLAFLPALNNGWVNWDDMDSFLRNPEFRGLGWPQIRWAWSTYLLGVYQPFGWMLLEAEYVAWGLDPRGYHLVSLLIHSLNAVLVYVLCHRLVTWGEPGSERRCAVPASALAAALFAVHPLRVEAVAWASCQTYLPCFTFMLLTVLAYLRAHEPGRGGRAGWLAAALALYAVALLFKAAALSLPAVLVALDVIPLRRLESDPRRWFGRAAWGVWKEKLPFLVLSIPIAIAAVRARASGETSLWDPHFGAISRLTQACYGIGFVIAKTLVPVGLHAFYPIPEDLSPLRPPFLPAILLVVGVSAAALVLLKRGPGLGVSWAAALALLAPSLGLVRVGHHLIADRYSYAASVVGAVALAWLLTRILRPGGHPRLLVGGFAATSLVLVAGLTFLTRAQCRTWHDSYSLWEHAVAQDPGPNFLALNNLGAVLTGMDRPDEIFRVYDRLRSHLEELVRAHPENIGYRSSLGMAYHNISAALRQLGRRREAAEAGLRAVEHQRIALARAPQQEQYRALLSRHLKNLEDVRSEP